MNLFKKIAFYVLIVAALFFAVWGYFHLKQSKKPALKAIEVLPDSAICVLNTYNFSELANKLSNQNLIWNEVINVKEINFINQHIQFFDSIIGENENLKDFFKNESIYLSLYAGKNNLTTLISFNLKDLAQEKDFTEELMRAIKTLVKTEWGFEFTNNKNKFYLKLQQGVVLISNEVSLIQNAFTEGHNKLLANKNFKSLLDLSDDEGLLNIYTNHDLFNSQSKLTAINSLGLIFGGNSLSNVEVNPDEISFNGFNLPDSLSVLNCLISQQAQTCDFLNMLPFNTIAFKALGFSDFNLLRKKINLNEKEISAFWKNVNDSAMFSAEKQFYENVNNKIIEIELKTDSSASKAALVELKDTAKMLEIIPFFSDSMMIFQNIKMYRLNNKSGNIAATFGNTIKLKPSFAFVFGNYFILTETKKETWYFINALNGNSVLSQNEIFLSYAKENLNLKFNYLYYSSLNKNTEQIKEVFEFVNEKDLKHFDKLSDFCLSICNYKDLLQFRVNLKHHQQQQNAEATPNLWTFAADTTIQTKAWPFVNHKTGENEIVLQDAANNLYLINATGNVLWKKQIGENVKSEIFTVDALKNKKFQLLFNTENYLHLIDRNGNEVAGYPVKLPAKASNQLSLFDYENTRDYRLFIACADKKIYNYGINGIKNEGFTIFKSDDEINLPIKYVKVGASDYLITADAEGKIYVLSRKGDGRINCRNRLTQGCKQFYIDASNNIQNTKLFYVDDKSSLIENITLADKKDAIKLSEDFENALINYDLIDDDKKTDIIILTKTNLNCFDVSGNKIFSFAGNETDYSNANYFFDSDGAYFILNNKNEIQVVDVATKTISKKFSGKTKPLVFDLFKDGKKYILVSEGNTLKCVVLK